MRLKYCFVLPLFVTTAFATLPSPGHPDLTFGPTPTSDSTTESRVSGVRNVGTGIYYADLTTAIAAATAGDTLEVDASSISDGPTITIDKDLTIQGFSGSEVITPTGNTTDSGDGRGWFLVNPGVDVTIRDLVFDGAGFEIWQAIRHRGSGLIEDCIFQNISYEESGPSYAGSSIVAFGDLVDVRRVTISNFGRHGLFYFGPGTNGSIAEDLVLTGKGGGDYVNYGVEVGGGAQITLRRARITDCQGVNSVDGTVSAGILVSTFFAAGTQLSLETTDLEGNGHGAIVGSDAADTSVMIASMSRIVDNTTAAVNSSAATATVTMENVWWGCNAGPGNPGCGSFTGSGFIDADPWLVLDLLVAASTLTAGQTTPLQARLTTNSDGTDVSGLGAVPDGLSAGFAAVAGSVLPIFASTIGGVATTTYTALLTPGLDTVDATVDNQTVSIEIDVKACSSSIFVDVDAPPAGDGIAWSSAFDNLQNALTSASAGTCIRVAEGVYYPDIGIGQIGNSVTSTFTLNNGVEVYGGFDGSEPFLSDRDPAIHITVLSGDIDGDDSVDGNGITRHYDHLAGSNAWHLVTAAGTDTSAVLDGLTLTAGWAAGSGSDQRGSAIVCNGGTPTLNNLHVIGNQAEDRTALWSCPGTITGSVFEANKANDVGAVAATPATYIDTVFISNYGRLQGSLFYLAGGTLTMTNCQVVGNSSGNTAAIRVSGTIVDFDNVLFSGNSSSRGAAIDFSGSAGGSIVNSTFTGSKTSNGEGAIRFISTGNLEISNSIFWDNQTASVVGTLAASIFDNGAGAITVTSSILQGSGGSGSWTGGTINDGSGNLDVDPLFYSSIAPNDAPTTSGDFHLLDGSQAINAGDNSVVTTSTDLDGEDRVQDTDVDMGPYEGSDPWVDLSITKNDGVTSAIPGMAVTYTITAVNAGASDASPVSLVDTFPSDLTCSWSNVTSGGVTGTTVGAGDLNEILTMPAGSAVTYTATCSILPSLVGTLSNTATISSAEYDPFSGNNSATDDNTQLTPTADLSITKDNGLDFLAPGATVTYTITVASNGPSDIIGATVDDEIPPELSSCVWSCVATGTTCSWDPGNDLFDVIDLPVGATATYSGVCTVGSSASVTTISNTAYISIPGGSTDSNLGNNSATDDDLGALIFWDGFESGDANLWSAIAKGSRLLAAWNEGDDQLAVDLDLAGHGRGQADFVDGNGHAVLRIRLYASKDRLYLVAAARLDNGSWVASARETKADVESVISVLWQRASNASSNDGELSVLVDGITTVQLHGLSNNQCQLSRLIGSGGVRLEEER